MSVKLPNKVICPYCGKGADGQTDSRNIEGNELPKAGDMSICGYCFSINVFADDSLEIRQATPEELVELQLNNPETYYHVLRMQKLVSHVVGLMKSKP